MFACVLSVIVLSSGAYAVAPTVTFDGTTFTGIDRPNCRQFQGIKYANAPRFSDNVPVTVASLGPNYDATQSGPMCMQYCPPLPEQVCLPTQPSEDCLFLNIFTPKGNPTNRAVIFYLHGGNYRTHSGAAGLYDGNEYARVGNVILVTINYRLGAFGFLGGSNHGIKDMATALIWVHQNIHHFGGNPAKITAMGQSVGGLSIPILLTLPQTKNLINRMILQSAPLSLRFLTQSEATQQENQLAAALSCTPGDLACYNTKTADQILMQSEIPSVYSYSNHYLSNFMPWAPTIGSYILDQPFNLFSVPEFRNVDLLIGDVEDEGVLYVADSTLGSMTVAELDTILDQVLPGLSSSDLSILYPTHPTDQRFTLADMTTDYIFRCPSRKIATTVKSKGKKSFKYTFKAIFPIPVWGATSNCNSYVCHGIDIVYTFNSAALAGLTLPASHLELSNAMIEYFTNFAKNGDVNRYTYFWIFLIDLHPGPRWYQASAGPLGVTTMMLLEPGARTSYVLSTYREEYAKCFVFDSINQYA